MSFNERNRLNAAHKALNAVGQACLYALGGIVVAVIVVVALLWELAKDFAKLAYSAAMRVIPLFLVWNYVQLHPALDRLLMSIGPLSFLDIYVPVFAVFCLYYKVRKVEAAK